MSKPLFYLFGSRDKLATSGGQWGAKQTRVVVV